MVRRLDLDWPSTLAGWSNYDLDALEQHIREERMHRQAAPKKGFLVRD